MKKRNISFLAVLAFVFAIASAFTTKMKAEAAVRQATQYYWFNTSNVYVRPNPIATEKSLTGCSSTLALCENGYTGDQFNTKDDPHSGLKMGAVATPIRKNTN